MVQDFKSDKKLPLFYSSKLLTVTQTLTAGPNAGIIQSCPHSNIVRDVVFFLLGESPASEFYVPTYRNTQTVPSSQLVQAAYTTYEDGTGRVFRNVGK